MFCDIGHTLTVAFRNEIVVFCNNSHILQYHFVEFCNKMAVALGDHVSL